MIIHKPDSYWVSYKGRKDNNEDCVIIRSNKKSKVMQMVIAVADGMGGYENGDVASRTVIDYLEKFCEIEIPLDYVKAAEITRSFIRNANTHIFELCKKQGIEQMGTTVSGALIIDNKCLFFNVGDSRVYLLNSKGINQVSHDHSADMEAFENGDIREEDIGKGFYANALTRSIGIDNDVDIDIFPGEEFLDLSDGEAIFVCTDGLWKFVDNSVIHREIVGRTSLDKSLESMAASAYVNGSDDNISMAIVEFGEMKRSQLNLGDFSPVLLIEKRIETRKKILRRLIIISVIAFLIVFALIILKITSGMSQHRVLKEHATNPRKIEKLTTTNLIPSISIKQRKEKINDTGLAHPDIRGGVVHFSSSDRILTESSRIYLSFSSFFVRGNSVPADIIYTINGSNPTRENGFKYEKDQGIFLNRPGQYTINAKVISKLGKYDGEIYSQDYIINRKIEDSYTRVIKENEIKKLGILTRREIFNRTSRIEILVDGITQIQKKKHFITVRIRIDSYGRIKVKKINGLIVIPEEKSEEVEFLLRQKIEKIHLLPPICEMKPVIVEFAFDIEPDEITDDKIIFIRKDV